MSKLVSGYLSWKYAPSPLAVNSPSVLPHAPASTPASPWDFSMPVINLYTLETTAYIHRGAEVESVAEALVLNGYLPTTPESPSLAVSLKTLELLRCIRIRKPSLSIQAFAKVISDQYGVCISHL
jgi:hypothetical protein